MKIEPCRIERPAYRFMSPLVLLTAGLAAGCVPSRVAAQPIDQKAPVAAAVGTLDAGDLDPAIPPPASVLGHPVADKPVRHETLVGYLRALAEASPRVTITSHAKTHEGRALYYLTITALGLTIAKVTLSARRW